MKTCSLTTALTTLALLLSLGSSQQQQCKFPAPSQNFTRDAYSGVWYEIAKFQTAGGAYFEKDCVCTSLNVTEHEYGAYKVNNICRYKTPGGAITNALENLFDEAPAGHFKANFFPLAPSVDYTILLIGEVEGEEYSVEYDCGSSYITGTNYCVHFLSRKPTMSQVLLNHLIAEVNSQFLNTENLPLQMTMQDQCWDNSSSQQLFFK